VDTERRCTGCMLCAMICPEAAITVFREVKVEAAAGRLLTVQGVTDG
jgi:Fe-S-cluster-containing hydrogenase component 2